MAEQSTVEERIAALEARILELEAERTRPPSEPTPAPAAEDRPPPSRRALLGGAGVAAAGAAAAAIAAATPAAATDGQPIYQASYNDGTNVTILRATYNKVLSVSDTLAAVGAYAAALNVYSSSGTFGIAVTSTQSFGAGVFTDVSSGTSYGASLNGGAGNMVLPRNGVPGPSRGYSATGALLNDSAGDLWMKVSNTEWRKLTGPSTAGALHPITPVRIFDSRVAGWGGKFTDETRVIDAKIKSGPLPAPSSGIPDGVTSLVVNLAVTDTNSGGYGALWTNGVAWPGNASINWGQSNLTLSNGTLTAVNASRTFQCKVAGSAHVIIDVVGYYR